MDKQLIDIAISIHKQKVNTLKSLESELVEMISKTNNEPLQDKFIEWMNQRNLCNDTYLSVLDKITI